MDYVTEFNNQIQNASIAIGKPLSKESYEVIDRGIPHKPVGLPIGKMGIYTFLFDGHFLKIGKAGANSDARFRSQHYGFYAPSTLAKSIVSDAEMDSFDINETNVGDWIKANCRRIDVLIDSNMGIFALEFVEGLLHYLYEPKYEGFKSQRK